MQICRELAGYSYARADLVRRAMSKKKADVMEKERKSFIWGAQKENGDVECVGAVANGVPPEVANQIFDDMSSFASYAFNKSHAAAYALVAYQTAYLKCHHPKEYMAALLTSQLDSADRVVEYIAETRKMGIKVLPPDVNHSDLGFVVVGEGIRFGLLAVKNLGRGLLTELLKERESRPFSDLLDFFERMYGKDLNRRAVESLIKCGAFDEFGHEREEMLGGAEKLMDTVEAKRRSNIDGQMDLFGEGATVSEYTLPKTEPLPLLKRLEFEKETTGMYITGHPLSEYDYISEQMGAAPIRDILGRAVSDGGQVKVLGIISSKKLKTTRNNDMMAFISIEDKTGAIEAIVFPKSYQMFSGLLVAGSVVAVFGRVKSEDEGQPQIICEAITKPQDAKQKPQPKDSLNQGIYLKFLKREHLNVSRAINLLSIFEGSLPVYFYYQNEKKYTIAPKEHWITPNDVLTRELQLLLGEENVVLR